MALIDRRNTLVSKVVALTIILSIAAPAYCETRALVLSQWEEIAGDHEVIATPDALRIFSKKSQTTLIAKAPAWKVFFFNNKRKVLLESDGDKWRCPFGLAMGVVAAERFKSGAGVGVDLGPAKIAGLAARRISEVAESEDTRMGKLVGMSESKAHYYVYDSRHKLPRELCHIMQRSFGMPPADGIPLMLEVDQKMWGKGWHSLLKTNSSRLEVVDKKLFDVPTNYRKVRSDSDVVFSNDQELINDFAEEMTGAESSKKH